MGRTTAVQESGPRVRVNVFMDELNTINRKVEELASRLFFVLTTLIPTSESDRDVHPPKNKDVRMVGESELNIELAVIDDKVSSILARFDDGLSSDVQTKNEQVNNKFLEVIDRIGYNLEHIADRLSFLLRSKFDDNKKEPEARSTFATALRNVENVLDDLLSRLDDTPDD